MPGDGWKKETGKISPINWWKLISAGNKQQAFLIPRQESGKQLERKTPRTIRDDRNRTFYCICTASCDIKTTYFISVTLDTLVNLFKNWKEQPVSVLGPVSRGHSWSFGLISAQLQSPAVLSGVNLQAHAGVSAGISVNQCKKKPQHTHKSCSAASKSLL